MAGISSDGQADGRADVMRWIGNLSLLAALSACLLLWSGVVLLLSAPPSAQVIAMGPEGENDEMGVPIPTPVMRWEGVSEARRSLAEWLLFWLPLGAGALACSAGVVALAGSRGREADVSRRASIALVLSVVPACLCTLWVLTFAVAPLLTK